MTFEDYAVSRLPVMLATARAITADCALAEDLVQDVLIKLHARWSAVERIDSLDAYVRRMLVNEFISWRRKWARLVPVAEPRVEFNRWRLYDPGELADAVVDREALMSELRRLPNRQRVILGLRYFADSSDEEIADLLGCAQSTVRVHAARALSALRSTRTQQGSELEKGGCSEPLGGGTTRAILGDAGPALD